MKKQTKTIYFLLMFFSLSFLNFYFSHLIANKLLNGWHFSTSLFKIIYIENTGAAFSILQNSTMVLIIFSTIALLGILYYAIKNLDRIDIKVFLFISFLMSGIIGNLYERIHLGYVRDFFDLNFVNFPIFNISDIFINIGVAGIIVLILLMKKSAI